MTKSADQIDGPKLSRIIIEEAQLILNMKVDFDSVFHNMTEGNEHIPFYKARKDYYGHWRCFLPSRLSLKP